MANNEYAIRFTEEKYLNKKEVAKEMKMSIIDTIWSNVLAYRSNFYQYLPLKSIERSSLFICLCLNVDSKNASIDKSINHLLDEEKKLSAVNGDSQYFTLSSYVNSLNEIKKYKKYELDEKVVKELINGKRVPIDDSERHIHNYLLSLKYIENHVGELIDEDYAANLYAKLSGQEELISFYRVEEDNSSANKMLIDRLYSSAPVHLIEPMMSYLFDFIKNVDISVISKALIAYYYIDYVKPFNSYNEEMASLISKAILTNNYSKKAVLLNIEGLMNEKENEIARYNEVQKTQDVTYFVIYGYDYLSRKIKASLEQIIEYSSNTIRDDFYREEKEEEKVEIKPIPKEEVKETPVVETPAISSPALEVKEEIIKPVVNESKVINKQAVREEIKEEVKENVPNNLAVSFIPPELDEKTAARLTTHLLECDPNLKKGEAYFYARHCTLGKIYTIQQYKKCLGVVYETARTSMDHLKELGYYQESMIKNKKVYTPVKR